MKEHDNDIPVIAGEGSQPHEHGAHGSGKHHSHRHHEDESECRCHHDEEGHEHHHHHDDDEHEHHHHHHHEELSPEAEKRERLVKFIRWGASIVLAVLAYFIPWSEKTAFVGVILYVTAYIISAYDVLIDAARNIAHGRLFDETFLMTVASVGAMCVGEFPEAVAVMIFFGVGEMLEERAEGKSRDSIKALAELRPDRANVERGGKVENVSPASVELGEIIVVKPGERVPLDGTVVSGSSALDTSALTGESLPRDVGEGGSVLAGCVNLSGVLRLKVTNNLADSAVSRIMDLMESSAEKKSRSERFITRFSRRYTPAVCIAALLTAVIPPLVFHAPWSDWIYRALSFLVISCPCALVISVPLAFFGGLGRASRNGVLIKGSDTLDALADADCVMFDKTGTLTTGEFAVTAVKPEGISEEELLSLASRAEYYSDHPIARSIKAAAGGEPEAPDGVYKELAGRGVCAEIGRRLVFAGNDALMGTFGFGPTEDDFVGTCVRIAVTATDGSGARYLGRIELGDTVKPTSASAVSELRRLGVAKQILLTGDSGPVARSVAALIGIDDVRAELLPADKVEQVEKELKDREGSLIFVGDGINDAPALVRSDVGVAMGAFGSEAAIEAADAVLLTEDPKAVATAIDISRNTRSIAKQNIIFSIAAKVIILLLTLFGVFGDFAMPLAVFADVGIMVLATLNAMRALKAK